jgi:TolB-like protein
VNGMTRLALLLSSLSLAAPPALALAGEPERKVVAVVPFETPARLHGMGENAQPTFVTELVKSKKVRVVDEKRMKDAVGRFERDQSGLFDASKVKQLGRFLKADYVVVGAVSDTPSR